MAFPLDSAHVISHLRSSYLVQFEDDDDARRLIKPYLEDPDGEVYKPIFDRLTLLSSPPIALHAATSESQGLGYGARSAARSTRSRKVRRRRALDQLRLLKHLKPVLKLLEPAPNQPLKPLDQALDKGLDQILNLSHDEVDPHDLAYDSPDETPDYDQLNTVTPKPKKRTGLMRIFQGNSDKNTDTSDSDSSNGSVKSTKIDDQISDPEIGSDTTQKLMAESTPLQMLGSHEDAISLAPSDYNKNRNGDNVDSDLATLSSQKLRHKLMSNSASLTESSSSIPGDQDDYFDSDDEIYDDDEDLAEGSSTDSAFTDIETDSIMNSSMLLDSFDTTEFSYSKKSGGLSSKMRKKKSRIGSFAGLNSTKDNSHDNVKPKAPISSSSTLDIDKTPSMQFEKVGLQEVKNKDAPKTSNLSSLIQSRSKSANSNPLNYYSFVNDDLTTKSAKVLLDIFVPPKRIPTLHNLSVNNNVAIVDCIGYILLHLCDNPDFKSDLNCLNPNHWRLELVDEDGENYGSFGILDRTRLLSSYNNPKELALCRVEDDKEVMKNENQTPLAVEFKQNLVAFRRKKVLEELDDSTESRTHDDLEMVELTIVTTDSSKAFMSVDSNASVQEVLYDFCAARNLNPDNYRFRFMAPEGKDFLSDNSNDASTLKASSTMNDTGTTTRMLMNNELIRELGSTILQVVPARIGPVKSLLNNNSMEISPIDNNISPSADMNIITPPKNLAGVLVNTTQSKPPERSKKEDDSTTIKPVKSAKSSAQDSNKYFDDLMTGMNSQLPSNSKTKYFTWKVWRKKTTILNKIEKSLIIDGDYIRLQPPEDKAYTKDPNDNPFLASQGGHSHHHHLHHYNYSNYYNGSMMKTSSFHITQLVKLKQYKGSKNPNHFKIVIEKPGKDSTPIKKKYDLEAVSESECEAIIDKIRWVSKLYNAEMANIK